MDGIAGDVELLYATVQGGSEDSLVLPAGEEQRAASFGSAMRRAQYRLGRSALRTLAAVRLGLPPLLVPLEVEEGGAPFLGGHEHLFVSVAHGAKARGVRVLAALGERPVGVDLERVRPVHAGLAARLLLPGEGEVLGGATAALGLPSEALPVVGWTLKEAVLKGERVGLRAGLRAVRLHGPPEALVAEGPTRRWALRVAEHDGFVLALAWAE